MKTFVNHPRRRRLRAGLTVTILLLGLGLPGEALARNPIRQAFFNFYPSTVDTRLDTLPSRPGHCGVCHYDFSGGGTRNPYGQALENSGFSLNNDTGRSNALWAVRHLDSDGDGFTSQVEVTDRINYGNTPTFPGLHTGNTNLVRNVALSEIAGSLTPTAAQDTTPPNVVLLFPNGGEVLTANRATNVTWNASDASGVASVSLELSLDNGVTYQPIARGLANTGTFSWVPANRPTTQGRLRVLAVDTFFNSTNDLSDNLFTIVSPPGGRVATTLRDFDLPGTQPFQAGPELEASANCATCHGGYHPAVEPSFTWQGSMMAHASRDLLFRACMVIANQDAPDSGDLCVRCHLPRGWLGGRSVPTDGRRLTAADGDGVSCALCHQMVDPIYSAGTSPTNDLSILAALTFAGTNFGNGMFVIDPTTTRRGPFSDTVSPHPVLASPFHKEAAFCGTCHDVSNPVYERDAQGRYLPNAFNTAATNFSPHVLLPVERTYSEWLHSDYNSPAGVYAPAFAGNRPDGRVSTCQDCHMRPVTGYGCNPTNNAGIPLRTNLPLHDLTGGSTWLPSLLPMLYSNEVNAAAIQAGIQRAEYLLAHAATLSLEHLPGQLRVTVTNESGHKLPTGYPEGRRVWLNVRFYNETNQLLAQSGAYNPTNGVLTQDVEAKIYEAKPGLSTNLATALGLPPGPSFHFVLNDMLYKDNRIPPRGFTNATYALFGALPVAHSYADGQYWDQTLYTLPEGVARAEVRLYYQSTSKEYIEFLRDENRTDSQGQALYDLWRTNGMCPPTLMAQAVWEPVFLLRRIEFTSEGVLRFEFLSQPGITYTIEFTEGLANPPLWQSFTANGSLTATSRTSFFEDDFTTNTSGGPSATGMRFYRFRYTPTP